MLHENFNASDRGNNFDLNKIRVMIGSPYSVGLVAKIIIREIVYNIRVVDHIFIVGCV